VFGKKKQLTTAHEAVVSCTKQPPSKALFSSQKILSKNFRFPVTSNLAAHA